MAATGKARAGADPAVEAAAGEELVILVVRTAKALVDRLRGERPGGDDAPITVVHGLAARYLMGRDDVTTVELARYLGITKQSTSEVVRALERAGMVRRARHPSDGRARVLLLTDEGQAKLDAGRRRWQDLEAEWSALVGRDRLDLVREALEAFLTDDLVGRETRAPAAGAPDC